ncbi:MAG: hypothetical protein HY655_08320 [Acidobacteria bacterium]|nr:hypothetical protein [Acidobacteriota bacterium]
MDQSAVIADVHARVATEAAALASRSAEACTAVVLRELESVRKALETAGDAVAGAMTTSADAQEIDRFVDRVVSHLGVDALRAQLHERNTAARAELDAARQELASEHARSTAAHAEAAQLRATAEALRMQLEDERAANLQLAEQETIARAELEAARQEAQEERARATAACAEAADLRASFDASLDDLQREHAMVLDEQARTFAALPLDQLLSVFHNLGNSETIPDVLVALAEGIAREFPRVALFRMNRSRLECTRQVGFDAQGDLSKIAIPLTGDSLLTRCVKTGQLEGFLGAPHSAPRAIIPFGGAPACALAMPVTFQGGVALIYADDSEEGEFSTGAPQARAKFAELLYRHALLVVGGLSSAQGLQPATDERSYAPATPAAASPDVDEVPRALRELAFKLTDALEREYSASAEIGRNRLACRQRLKEQLAQSRRLYAERILRSEDHLEGPRAASFLDDHLMAVARGRPDTSFGSDLATLVAS